MVLCTLASDQLELLGGPEHLRQTLAKAAEFGRPFAAPELAEQLELKLPNLNARLTALVEAGALRRERDQHASRGIKFRYCAPSADDVVPASADPTEMVAAINSE